MPFGPEGIDLMMDRLPFRVCPDYGQFYLEDLGGPRDAPEDLEAEDFRRRFRSNGRLIAVYPYVGFKFPEAPKA
jgi:hypothetical protein